MTKHMFQKAHWYWICNCTLWSTKTLVIWVFVWTFIIHRAFTYSSLQIACTVDDFLLLLYFKLFHLLLLQRGQATTRVVYNIKFMSRWYSFNLYMQGKKTGVSTSIEVYVIMHVVYDFHWCNSRTRTNVHLTVTAHSLERL